MSGTTQRAVARANRSALKRCIFSTSAARHAASYWRASFDFRSTTLIGIEPLERHPAAQQNAMEFVGIDSIFSDIALSGFTSQEEPPLPPSRSVSKALRALTCPALSVSLVLNSNQGDTACTTICAFCTSRRSYQH
jgi:hypothetical protein